MPLIVLKLNAAASAVLWATDGWLAFCGFSNTEMSGQTLRILQGRETDRNELAKLNVAGTNRCAGEATLINYTKSRIPFRHTIVMEPLVDSYGQMRIFRARSRDIEVLGGKEYESPFTARSPRSSALVGGGH